MLITPEDSLLASSSSPQAPASPPKSLNVSINSSWVDYDEHQPSSIDRYLHNPERHESLALSIYQQVVHEMGLMFNPDVPIPALPHPKSQDGSELVAEVTTAQTQAHPRSWSPMRTPPRATDAGTDQPSYNPMQRYLSSPQAHERVAIGLDRRQKQQHRDQPAVQDARQEPRQPATHYVRTKSYTPVISGSAIMYFDPPVEARRTSSSSAGSKPSRASSLSSISLEENEVPGHNEGPSDDGDHEMVSKIEELVHRL